MSFEQAALLILLAVMLTLFSFDRFRIEIVSIAGVLAGYALGLYRAADVFSGVANPAVITVIEVLLIVQVLARGRLFGTLAERFAAAKHRSFTVIAGLSGLTAFISVFMNNIGAYAIALPAALRLSEITGIPRKQLIMPISFAALLGGLVSLIGTPANLLVSDALAQATGKGFAFFDFAFAGLPVAVGGILIIAFVAPRLFPAPDESAASPPPAAGRRIITERSVPSGSPLVGRVLADCIPVFGVRPHALIRKGKFVFGAPEKTRIAIGDLLLAEADEPTFERLSYTEALLPGVYPDIGDKDVTRLDAVVMPESTLIGSHIRSLEVFHSRGVAVTGLSARSPRVEGRFADLRLSIGDILQLEGRRQAIDEALEECECLPLAATEAIHAAPHHSLRPLLIFIAGVAASATGLFPPEIAFAGVILALTLLNHLNIRQAMADLNWPIIIMLAAMIPLGTAVATTGTAATLAAWLSETLPVTQPAVGIALVLALGTAITPFVNNATVAIVLTPIAFELAKAAGHAPQAYLLAVAAGASLDFLTPFGHHNNTLTMSIGGYRFADFVRGGWLLTLFGYVCTLLILYLVWI